MAARDPASEPGRGPEVRGAPPRLSRMVRREPVRVGVWGVGLYPPENGDQSSADTLTDGCSVYGEASASPTLDRNATSGNASSPWIATSPTSRVASSIRSLIRSTYLMKYKMTAVTTASQTMIVTAAPSWMSNCFGWP